jgi:hypothetical protein
MGDWIIAEINNNGEIIENTLRMVVEIFRRQTKLRPFLKRRQRVGNQRRCCGVPRGRL